MASNTNEQWTESATLGALMQLRKQLIGIQSLLKQIADSDSVQDRIDALVLMHTIKAEIGIMYSDYSNMVIDALPDIPFSASNGQSVEKKTGADRKTWQHENLTREVLRRLGQMSVDIETGEVVMSSEDIALKLLDYVQPSYWRVKELSKIGINADQYCEIGEAKTNLIVHKEA